MWTRNLWNNHIDELWDGYLSDQRQIRGQTFWMFHLKTNNLAIPSTIKPSFVSIQSMHFVFPFCPISFGYLVIPISKQTWEIEATHFSDFTSFLPIRVFSYGPTWEFFNVKFTLRNLVSSPKSTLLDRGFAEIIFPNATYSPFVEQKCFCCNLNLAALNPSLIGSNVERFETFYTVYNPLPFLFIRESDFDILFTTNLERFTFLSCGEPFNNPLDFEALFLPYSKITWALIFITIFGWPFVLSLIENDFKFKKVIQDFDALFIGWAMLLEQSHLRATNYKGRGALYCYCCCVLFAVFILSNAYKGDNIQSLSKSFELVPLTTMVQIVEAGYDTYTREFCDMYADPETGKPFCIIEFSHEASKREQQFSKTQYKLWEPMHIDRNLSSYQGSKLTTEFFGNCSKKAVLGWRSLLEPVHSALIEKFGTSNVNLGEEFLFQRRLGWRLKRYGSIKVLKRMWTVVESGIHDKLLNISHKSPAPKVSEPRQLTIHGNILVQFVILSFGVLLAWLVFTAELHRIIAWSFYSVRMKVDFLIKTWLHRSQKALILGVKYLCNKK